MTDDERMMIVSNIVGSLLLAMELELPTPVILKLAREFSRHVECIDDERQRTALGSLCDSIVATQLARDKDPRAMVYAQRARERIARCGVLDDPDGREMASRMMETMSEIVEKSWGRN